MIERFSDKYYEGRREDLIRFIPPDAKRILDVGCGTGETGLSIKNRFGSNVEVSGIELDSRIGETAKVKIDRVIIGDVEQTALPFDNEYFDCIIYGDILEHLVDPWGILKRHLRFLKKDGCIIASIPNIAHYRTSKMLRKKEWNYRDAGILDKSHLRFFTIKSIKEMFEGVNMKIVKIGHKIGASDLKKLLNKLLFNILIDGITEQYIIVARRN